MTDSSYKISQSKLNLFFEDILDSIKIGIVILNNKNFIEKMNEGINNMFGYKQDDLQLVGILDQHIAMYVLNLSSNNNFHSIQSDK